MAGRVIDNPILSGLDIPLPNINAKSNAKSVTTCHNKEEKRANYLAKAMSKVPSHRI